MEEDPNKLEGNREKFSNEPELPETVFERDIEDRVFQALVVQCLSEVEGVALLEGGRIQNFLKRSSETIPGIQAEKGDMDHSINVKVELKIAYGVPIPEKAEEIQSRVAQHLSKMTGLHVSKVHVVFTDLIMEDPNQLFILPPKNGGGEKPLLTEQLEGDYE